MRASQLSSRHYLRHKYGGERGSPGRSETLKLFFNRKYSMKGWFTKVNIYNIIKKNTYYY